MRIFFIFFLLAGLVALSCNTDPTVFGWLEKFLDFFNLNTPELRAWIVHHPKLWHVVYYFIFTATSLVLWRRKIWIAPLLVFFVGVLLELIQIFVPTRTAQARDLLFNLAGILLATGGVFLWRRFRKTS